MSDTVRYLVTVDTQAGRPVKVEEIGESGELTEVPLSTLGFDSGGPSPQSYVVNVFMGGGAPPDVRFHHEAGGPGEGRWGPSARWAPSSDRWGPSRPPGPESDRWGPSRPPGAESEKPRGPESDRWGPSRPPESPKKPGGGDDEPPQEGH